MPVKFEVRQPPNRRARRAANAGAAVERVLSKAGRVVIADPLGAWYGLRLLADGKTPSPHNVVIFGGPHGDLPITDHAGALIGETVAKMAESCVLDLSSIGTKAAERRFMLAFLTALYRNAAGEPVHVVFDEAVLSQVDGLIAFKLTSSQDRDAIGAWVEGSADKQQWREMENGLAY